MGNARKKKRVVSDECSAITETESDVNLNVIIGKDLQTTRDLDDHIEIEILEHVTVRVSCCEDEDILSKDHLSKLDSGILGFIFSLLDNDDLINVSTLSRRMRYLVKSMFFLSFKIPMSEEDLEFIRQNPYSHNKPVLRLNLTNPDMDSNVTKQLLVLNLCKVSEVFIKYDYEQDKDVEEFRIALIAVLQILIDFKMVKKLHLHVYPEFFINQITVFGRKLMGAMIHVPNINITLQERSKMEENVHRTLDLFGDFISSLTCNNLSIKGKDLFLKKNFFKVFKIENHFVKVLKLFGPCLFQPKLRLSRLEFLSAQCRDCKSSPPPYSDCVVTWNQVKVGCPVLQQIRGLGFPVDSSVTELKNQKIKRRQKKKTISPEVSSSPLIVSPSRKSSECAEATTELVFAKKSNPQTDSETMLDMDMNIVDFSIPQVQTAIDGTTKQDILTKVETCNSFDGEKEKATKHDPEPKKTPDKKIQKNNVPNSKPKKKKRKVVRRIRCGECDPCLAQNCGKCRFCLDMLIFGGRNKLRQACEQRTCVNQPNPVKDKMS